MDEHARWLELEIERVWLLVHRRLFALEAREAIAPRGDATRAELDRVLADRPPPPDITERLTSCTDQVHTTRKQVPLGRLADKLGLRELELEALIIALAPHLDEALDCAFRHLQSDYNRRGVDLALIAELLSLDRSDRIALLEVLDLDRPLIALRLLEAELGAGRSALFRAISPTLDALPVLSGRRAISPKLALAAQLVTGVPTSTVLGSEQLEALSEPIAVAASRLAGSSPPIILLWGPAKVGKREAARRVADQAGCPILVFNPTTVSGDGDEQLRRAKREALLAGAALYVGPCKDELAEDGARALLSRFAGYVGPLLIGLETSTPPQFVSSRPVMEIAVPTPSFEGRRELWQRAVPGTDIEPLARAYRLNGGEIAEIGREVASADEAHVAAAIERRMRTELSGLAQRVSADACWDELVLPPDQLERVRQLIDRHRHAQQVYEAWGMGERVRRGRGVISLFSGPPGTGKTMLAQIIAKELGLQLYKVDLSQVVSKWVGETEKQLSKIFELAERAHAVLLFDEADALLSKRTKVESANDRYGNLAVNYLLQRFEDYEGVVILTTNAASALDDAMARRLTAHLRLEEPDEDERLLLWQSMLIDKLPTDGELDLQRIAEDFELCGGHIKNAAVRAAFLAARQGTHVDATLLRRAAVLEMQDMGRIA